MKLFAAAFLLAALASAPSPLTAGERLALRVTPQVAFAPANLSVRAMVESDAENRSIEVIADSPEFYRSSEMQLDGDQAPRTSVFLFRDVPGGRYEIRAIVRGRHGQELAATHSAVDVVSQ